MGCKNRRMLVLCVRPSNALGAVERLRLGVTGGAGAGGGVAVRSKNQNIALWLELRARPLPLSGLHLEHSIPHTQRELNVEQAEDARRMDWKTLLAYITGTVDQKLLLRNEYLVTKTRFSVTRFQVACVSATASGRHWRKSARSWGSTLWRPWRVSSLLIPFSPGTANWWPRNLMAPYSARPSVPLLSTKKWKPWWCVWRRRIVLGL